MNFKLRYFIQVAKFKFGGVDTKLPIYWDMGASYWKCTKTGSPTWNRKLLATLATCQQIQQQLWTWCTSYHHVSDIVQGCAILWAPHDMVVVVQLEYWCTSSCIMCNNPSLNNRSAAIWPKMLAVKSSLITIDSRLARWQAHRSVHCWPWLEQICTSLFLDLCFDVDVDSCLFKLTGINVCELTTNIFQIDLWFHKIVKSETGIKRKYKRLIVTWKLNLAYQL